MHWRAPTRYVAIMFVVLGSLALKAGYSQDRPFTPGERAYWAFQKIQLPASPSVQQVGWSIGPIDAFVLDQIEKHSLKPASPADRATFLRRATLTATGLPPSEEQISTFLADQTPDATERLIDRLLASPHHGERWARHWLDLAIFAESSGFEQDETRPNAWRYRDYVVDAFNSDKPYDRFLTEQLAGDEVWPDDSNAQIATAFMRHYPEEGNNKDILLARQEMLHHITDVVGSTFLGLTFNCAQCHDHKYDPIRQADYYRLQAFFANVGHDDKFPIGTPNELREYQARLTAYELRTDPLWTEMDQLLATARKYSPQQLLARYPDYVIQAMAAPVGVRTPLQSQIAHILNNKDCGTCPQRPKPHADPFFAKDAKALKDRIKLRYEELKSELDRLEHLKPADLQRAMVVRDIGSDAPPTHVLGIGLYTSPKEVVYPGFLSILAPEEAYISKPKGEFSTGRRSTGRRSALAAWLANPQNPLTPRVMVNRVWHYHFGRGLVATPSDFGVMGGPPSHPELLDWLASRYFESGWSTKSLHREIMTSAVFRQSSQPRDQLDTLSSYPWLARFPVQRLDAESIRDAALVVAGLLNPSLGGPSVFPPLPEGRPIPIGGWKVNDNPRDHLRRSLYIFVRRNDRYPIFEAFDFPDPHESCACRNETTTPQQALTLLNGDLFTKWSEAFAKRLEVEAGSLAADQIVLASKLAFARPPTDWEKQAALDFVEQQSEIIFAERPAQSDAQSDSQDDSAEGKAERRRLSRHQALADYCLMLFNSNEFVFRF